VYQPYHCIIWCTVARTLSSSAKTWRLSFWIPCQTRVWGLPVKVFIMQILLICAFGRVLWLSCPVQLRGSLVIRRGDRRRLWVQVRQVSTTINHVSSFSYMFYVTIAVSRARFVRHSTRFCPCLLTCPEWVCPLLRWTSLPAGMSRMVCPFELVVRLSGFLGALLLASGWGVR
jgi:hypothetical protein